MKTHRNTAEPWLRPLLDTMPCNSSSKVKGQGRGWVGLGSAVLGYGIGSKGWGVWGGVGVARDLGTGGLGIWGIVGMGYGMGRIG